MSISLAKVYPPQPSTSRGRRTQLTYDPSNDRIAYGAGKQVVIRSLKASDSDTQPSLYTEHPYPVSSVVFSPNGHYIASADTSGHVNVWNTTGDTVITKGPFSATSGVIHGLAFDFENRRVIAVGDGKSRFGHCFLADSGNSVGEISGHSSFLNGVAIRPVRPLRAATVGEDGTLVFLHGAPFVFKRKLAVHTSAISDVAYSPDGSLFVTAGLDRKTGIFDGETGDFKDWIDTGHLGGILAVSFVSNSVVATVSTDCTLRLSSLESKTCTNVCSLEKTQSNQLVGVVATKSSIVTLGLGGDLHIWPLEGADEPSVVLRGHQKALTTLYAESKESIYSGCVDGSVYHWELQVTSLAPSHKAPIVGLAKYDGEIYSASWDKTFVSVSGGSKTFTVPQQSVAVDGAESTLVSLGDTRLQVVGGSGLDLEGGNAVALSRDAKLVAVGHNATTTIYSLPGLELVHKFEPVRGNVSVLSFSNNNKYLAAGDSSGKIIVYSVDEKKIYTSRWAFHTSRVTSIAWHDDNERAATGASDASIYLYSTVTPGRNTKFLNAHKDGVAAVTWADTQVIASAGVDGSVKLWDVKL